MDTHSTRAASDLSTRLDPKDIEPRIYRAWEESGVFGQDPARVTKDGVEP